MHITQKIRGRNANLLLLPSKNDTIFFRSGDDLFLRYILFIECSAQGLRFSSNASSSLIGVGRIWRCTPLFFHAPMSSHFQSLWHFNFVVSKRKQTSSDTEVGILVHVLLGFGCISNIGRMSLKVLTVVAHS